MDNSNNIFGKSPTPKNNNSVNNVNQAGNVNIPQQQNLTTINQENDDNLLKAFIGNNYEKITTRPFNFAGFFFTTFYMFYRKMFLYALLAFLLNLAVIFFMKNLVVNLALSVVVGLLVNKIYVFYAKTKIAVIKANNPQKSNEELKNICTEKGGTSVGKILFGFFTELVIALVILLVMILVGLGGAIGEFINLDNWSITNNGGSGTNNNSSTKDGTLLVNVNIGGSSCFNSGMGSKNKKCYVYIEETNDFYKEYELGFSNNDLITKLGYYKEYIKIDIYYNIKDNKKTIVNYKIYLKSSNEDISNVSTENELREKIGLHTLETHTESLTLKKIGLVGSEYSDNRYITYTRYTFVDSNNNEYEMKYIHNNGTLNLTEGQKCNVTFEVSKGSFEDEYIIKSIN